MVPSAKIGKEITPKQKRRWAHGRVLPNYESPKMHVNFFFEEKKMSVLLIVLQGFEALRSRFLDTMDTTYILTDIPERYLEQSNT